MKERRSHERSDLVEGAGEDLGAVAQEIGKRGKKRLLAFDVQQRKVQDHSVFSSVPPKKLFFPIWQVSEIIKAFSWGTQ